MNKLNELIKYILVKYPKIEELSKPRLVKLIYLIDWKHSIEFGEQYTDIRWIYNHYGPYVNDVINTRKITKTDILYFIKNFLILFILYLCNKQQ